MFFCSKPSKPPVNQIFVRDMIVETEIGVLAEEKGRKQRICINLIAEPLAWPNKTSDNIDDTVSYNDFVEIVLRHTQGQHIHLVETLAERIAEDCITRTAICKITVRVEKLDIYPFAIPGVEIVRAQKKR